MSKLGTAANFQEKLFRVEFDLSFTHAVLLEHHEVLPDHFHSSRSQLRQDLFVLFFTDYKQKGFFVEFGATDGINLSNTYLLETKYFWTGILAEPARVWHSTLGQNRPRASIETLCVWKDSNSVIDFREVLEPEYSTVEAYSAEDNHAKKRRGGSQYALATISLLDLLRKHNAPEYIDYLSIDTEGSEYEILNAFDFTQYRIAIITIEHNYTENRQLIYDLLIENGYKRVHEQVSAWDDWYVKI